MEAYESSRIYKEIVKRWHDKFISRREFRKGDLALLFNFRLKLFPGKLRSRWSGLFKLLKVYLYGDIKIGTDATTSFKVNGTRLKHYISSEPIEGNVSYNLPNVPSTERLLTVRHGT